MARYDAEERKVPLWSVSRAIEVLSAACARAEQCEGDLLLKMRAHGMSRPDAEHVLEQLRRGRFVDNARFARAYASDKVRFNGWGRTKVAMMLRSKRIESEHIKGALEALNPEVYAEVLQRLVRTEARKLDLERYEDRLKLYRKLYGRGFEGEMIKEAIAEFRESRKV